MENRRCGRGKIVQGQVLYLSSTSLRKLEIWSGLQTGPRVLHIRMGLSRDALKNLFDVLRTVNLTVTAISLGLLSNVIIALNDVTYLARKEVQDLERVKGQVGDYTANTLFQDVAREFGETPSFPLDISLSIDPNEKLFTQTFVDRLAIPSILHPVVSFGSEISKNDRYASGTNSPIKQFITLGQLGWFWNALAEKRYLLLAETAPLLVSLVNKNSNSEAFIVPHEIAPAPTPGAIYDVRNSDLEIRGDDSKPTVRLTLPSTFLLKDQRLRFQQREFDLILDLPARILHADSLVYLLSKCKKIDPKRVEANAFDDVFSNLAKLGANYRSLTLSDLDGILEDESKRSKGELEVFGAKIPSELVTWVGLPLLAVLLLQFSSVCGYITKRVDTIDVDVASQWSFLLSGFGFVLFGFGTTCLLPAIAAALSYWYVTGM